MYAGCSITIMPRRDRSRDSSVVRGWLLSAFHIDVAQIIGLQTPKILVYELARLHPTVSALVRTKGDLRHFSATVCEVLGDLLDADPLKNIDAMCTYARNRKAPRSIRFPKVRCFRFLSPLSTDGLLKKLVNLYSRLLLANDDNLRAVPAGVSTDPFPVIVPIVDILVLCRCLRLSRLVFSFDSRCVYAHRSVICCRCCGYVPLCGYGFDWCGYGFGI